MIFDFVKQSQEILLKVECEGYQKIDRDIPIKIAKPFEF
jgi:hypothetical protein